MNPIFKKVDCYSLPVSDLESAIEFYHIKLGHEIIWKSESGAGLRLPGSEAELVLHTDDRPMETDLLVESVPEAIEHFTKAGGKIELGPFEIKIGLCAVLRDPWNNKIIILDTSKGMLEVDKKKNVIN